MEYIAKIGIKELDLLQTLKSLRNSPVTTDIRSSCLVFGFQFSFDFLQPALTPARKSAVAFCRCCSWWRGRCCCGHCCWTFASCR